MRKLFFIAAIVYGITAFFSEGFHHSDEHFQLLEFAAMKWGITAPNDLAWEYHEKMRPAFQPAIVVAVHSFFGLFTDTPNPFVIISFLRFVSAAIALYALFLFTNAFRSRFTDEKLQRWFVLITLFLWFSVYVNVRFSSEAWSGSFFLLAFALLGIDKERKTHHFWLAGLFLGISFLCRYQTAFLTLGFGLWLLFIKREKFKNFLQLAAAFLAVFAAGTLIDRWFYGEWVITSWKYFEQNIVLNKMANFGIEPLWFYITETLEVATPPFSIIYIVSIVLAIIFRPKSVFTWSVLPFLLIHHITGHKELRFLFPMVNLLGFFVVDGIRILQENSGCIKKFFSTRFSKALLSIFWLSNILSLLVVMFSTSDAATPLYRFLYNNYEEPVTLHYFDSDPYQRALYIRYYKRQSHNTKHISSFKEIQFEEDKKQLVIFKKRDDIKSSPYPYKLVYQTFPKWMEKLNFNDWQSRSNVRFIYEVEKQ